jgi:hypothetical protein
MFDVLPWRATNKWLQRGQWRLLADPVPRLLITFLAPFLLYLLTLAPTIYNLDSAELATAVATNGIVRATGYPLYLLLGKLFVLLPVGDVGYRLNLFSAVCGALTIALADGILQRVKAEKTIKEKGDPAYEAPARDQGFRRVVNRIYDHRCALCGIRMRTPEGHTVVDAAHIVPWSVSQNDDPRNGLALCRLCHWTFDEGLLGISVQYTVQASPRLRAEQNLPAHLAALDGRGMITPAERDYWPAAESLAWHLGEVFRRR